MKLKKSLIFVLIVSLAVLLTGGLYSAAATSGDGTQISADDAASLSGEWFGDTSILNEDSPGYLNTLYLYFKYREADFIRENSDTSGSEALKSQTVSDFEKERTAALLNLREQGCVNILDACVSTAIQSCDIDGDTISVTAYEWTFFDYDDLRDDVLQPDVSGFGTVHQMTLLSNGTSFTIVRDSYDESDITGFSTSAVSYETLAPLAPLDASDSEPFLCDSYDPDNAVFYADSHVYSGADMSTSGVFESFYNPEYFNFNPYGGDCANYVSQCLYAGGLPQTLGTTYGQDGWFFMTENDRSGTWTSATRLRNWLANNYGYVIDNPTDDDIGIGDPVFYSKNGGKTWSHATICVGVNSAGTPIINSHNNDRYHVVWNYWPSGTTVSTVQLTVLDTPSEASDSDELSISMNGYPTTIITGNGFSVYGTITSETSVIESVTLNIYDMNAGVAIGGTFHPKTKNAVLSTLDPVILFGTLSPGWYYYTVTATNQSGTATLVNELFLVNDGTGTQTNPYLIGTADELSGLAAAVASGQTFKGKWFSLTSDIDASGITQIPIGTADAPFSGCIDGCAHTVYGLSETTTPVFGCTADGEIINLAADGCIVGTNGGSVINCMTTDNISSVVEVNNGSIKNCWSLSVGLSASEHLNTFVKNTATNGSGQYYLWKTGSEHPEFDTLSVSFYMDTDHTEPLSVVTGLPYAANLELPKLSFPDGTTVLQWYTDELLKNAWTEGSEITADTSLYADSKQETYDLVLDTSGGMQVVSPGLVSYGETVAFPTPQRDGYTFIGWFTSASGSTQVDWQTVPDLGSDGQTVTLYAGWTANTYELQLTAPEAENACDETTAANYGSSAININVLPEKTNAGFAGFYTAQGNQLIDMYGNLVSAVSEYTDDDGAWIYTHQSTIVLYAQWNDGLYTVTYHTNYGSLSGCDPVTENRLYTKSYESDAEHSLPVPIRSGYTFKGWYASADLSGPVIRTLNSTSNTDLYAKWIADYLVWENTFSDISETDWYYDAVKYVCQNDAMNGTSSTRFDPESALTRAMLVTILWRMEGAPAPSGLNLFDDVADGQWYTDAVSWAQEKGLISGYGNGLFGPDDLLTREAFVTILYRYAEYIGCTVDGTDTNFDSYSDAGEISSYALVPFSWAVEAGLVNGTASDTLSPAGNTSRAVAAVILLRFEEQFIPTANCPA